MNSSLMKNVILKFLVIIYLIVGIFSIILATGIGNWVGYTYIVLLCAAIFIDDFKIIKGYWVQFIPIPLTIVYLVYEHKPVMYMLKKIFNWE